MDLFGDVEKGFEGAVHAGEHGLEDVAHAGERGFEGVVHAGASAFGEVAPLLGRLRDVITGAGLGSAAGELEHLAEEANALRARLASAVGATRWTGAAAHAFQQRAHQRGAQISGLVKAIDAAHASVATAYTVAGIG